MLLLVTVSGGGAWLWQQRRQATDGAVLVALGEARLLRDQARAAPLGDGAKFREARSAAERAAELARAGGASTRVGQQAEALRDELRGEEEAANADRRLLAALLEVRGPREGRRYYKDEKGFLIELVEPSTDEQFAAAFRAWGLDVDGTPTDEAVQRLGARPAAVVTEVVAALDEWASERRQRSMPAAQWQRLAELAQELDKDPDPRRRELRAILVGGRLPVERALGALAVALRPVPVPFDAGPGADRSRLRRWAEQTDAATEPVLGLLTLARALQVAGDEAAAERLLRAAVRVRPGEVILHTTLGNLLTGQQPPRWSDAIECYTAARALRPDLGIALARSLVHGGRVRQGLMLYERLTVEQSGNPGAHFIYGIALAEQGHFPEAEKSLRKAIRLKDDLVDAHCNLGFVLVEQGRLEESEKSSRKAIQINPQFGMAHLGLGLSLAKQKRFEEAEKSFREAIRLMPDEPVAHYDFNVAFYEAGRYSEAAKSCREAIRLDPNSPYGHYGLGLALGRLGRYPSSEKSCREAIRLKPDFAEAHHVLGLALVAQGQFPEAEKSLREAIRLKPDFPEALCNLGLALGARGRFSEAEELFRKAICLKSDLPEPHCNLGLALYYQRRLPEAEKSLREAIRLKPDYPEALCNYGLVLQAQSRFTDALGFFQRGHALGQKMQGWNKRQSAELVRECERWIELDHELTAIQRGDFRPTDVIDLIELAMLCGQYKRFYSASTRFYRDAFAIDPKLANDLGQQDRYHAACAAALASCGQGEDAKNLPDKVAVMFRRQALAWLRADLAAYAKLAERDDPGAKRTVRQRLEQWQKDADLAGLRDPAALAQLPPDDREACQKLWTDVAALLARLDAKEK